MVASAAKSLLIKTCSDKNAANAKVCDQSMRCSVLWLQSEIIGVDVCPLSPLQFVMMVAALAAAAAIYWASVPWTFPLTIAVGGLATYLWNWNKDMALHVSGGGRPRDVQMYRYII